MKYTVLVIIVSLTACQDQKKIAPAIKNDNKSVVIQFLKDRFHIQIDTTKIPANYKKKLIDKNQNFSQDSLIGSQVQMRDYQPLNLTLITYHNYFGIPDSTHENEFSVNIIQDKKFNTFYVDFINDATGIYEDVFYCSWHLLNNTISWTDTQTLISKENIKTYNNIKSHRIYGGFESKSQNRKKGIELYLNSNFQYNIPDRKLLDSFLFVYDTYFYHKRDTLLTSRSQLYDFLTDQVSNIKSTPDYGDREKFLEYLKSQIGLIVIQTENISQQNLIYWIYKNNSNLRVRKLLISGNKTSTFFYTLDEYEICFK